MLTLKLIIQINYSNKDIIEIFIDIIEIFIDFIYFISLMIILQKNLI
jgi:hypothetical protein